MVGGVRGGSFVGGRGGFSGRGGVGRVGKLLNPFTSDTCSAAIQQERSSPEAGSIPPG
jgi:hypothetical protein